MSEAELRPIKGGCGTIAGYGADAASLLGRPREGHENDYYDGDVGGARLLDGTAAREDKMRPSHVHASEVDLCLAYIDDAVHWRHRELPITPDIVPYNRIYFSWPWFFFRLFAVLAFVGRPYLMSDSSCVDRSMANKIRNFEDEGSTIQSSAAGACSGPNLGFVIDFGAILVQLLDLLLRARIFGFGRVCRNGSLPLLAAEMLACAVERCCHPGDIWGRDHFDSRGVRCMFHASRVYFLVLVSDSVQLACSNAMICFSNIWVELSLPLLCILFFSCFVVATFGSMDESFHSLPDAFVKVFSLFTTSNNPDVWLQLYSLNWRNSIPFLIFIVTIVLFLQNFVVASIYSKFTDTVRKSYRERLASRRASLLRAFQSLLGGLSMSSGRGAVEPAVVYTVLQRLRPHYGPAKIQILYKAASPEDEFGMVNFEAFCRILKSVALRVRRSGAPEASNARWIHSLHLMLEFASPALSILFIVWISIQGIEWIHTNLRNIMIVFLLLSILGGVRTLVQMMVVGRRRSYRSVWFYFMLIGDLLTMVGIAMYFTSFNQEDRIYALNISNLGQLVSAAHLFKVFPSHYKVLCSLYEILPGLISNAVPLVCVLHVFVSLGVWLFGGLVSPDSDFGAGPGADPLFALLNFESYSNALVVALNLLVVNNWVKIASGLFDAMNNSLWIYLYFGLFFVVAVMFCLHSLMAIFVGALLLSESEVVLPVQLVDFPKFEHLSGHALSSSLLGDGSRASNRTAPISAAFEVTARMSDGDDILKIMETIQASDFNNVMDMLANMFSISLAVYKAKSGQVIYQSSLIEHLLLRYNLGEISDVFQLIMNRELLNFTPDRSSGASSSGRPNEPLPLIPPSLSSGVLRWQLPSGGANSAVGAGAASSRRVQNILEVRYRIQRGSASAPHLRAEHIVCVFKEISEARI